MSGYRFGATALSGKNLLGRNAGSKQITPHISAGLFGKLLGLAEGAEALCEPQLR
jgi:hypothetical protein